MGPRVLRAAALRERLRGGSSRVGRPLRGADGGADRGISLEDSRDRLCGRGRRLVRVRLLQPLPLPVPPHIPPARPGSSSVLPATNGRRELASQQPIAGRAATPHTPLSWKQTRHPRPAALAPHQPPRGPRPPRRPRPWAGGRRAQSARPGVVVTPPSSSPAPSEADVQEVGEEPGDPQPSSLQWPAPSRWARWRRARPLGSCSLPS